jgi:hypothetical protein
VDVVPPKEVISDQATGWVNYGDNPFQGEPLIALDV